MICFEQEPKQDWYSELVLMPLSDGAGDARTRA